MSEAFSGILHFFIETQEQAMSDDSRCCGTGTCIINAEGLCWCGQRWDGEKMCFMPEPVSPQVSLPSPEQKLPSAQAGQG
jgi:hypothetical protein